MYMMNRLFDSALIECINAYVKIEDKTEIKRRRDMLIELNRPRVENIRDPWYVDRCNKNNEWRH